VSPIREIERRGDTVRVNGERSIVALDPPEGFGAAVFEQEPLTDALRRGELPARDRVTDAFGYAAAALRFDLALAPSSSRDVYLAIPFGTGDAEGSFRGVSGAAAFDAAVRLWNDRLGRIEIDLPPARRAYPDTLATAIGHVLINRDGPRCSRGRGATPARGSATARSWRRRCCASDASRKPSSSSAGMPRSSATTASCPCVVDANGPDWLVEHDSHGELVFAVAECFRFTATARSCRSSGPRSRRRSISWRRCRATRLGPEYETPEKRARHGLFAGIGEPRGVPRAARPLVLGRLLGGTRARRRRRCWPASWATPRRRAG
jgi:hypothetical protein